MLRQQLQSLGEAHHGAPGYSCSYLADTSPLLGDASYNHFADIYGLGGSGEAQEARPRLFPN